MYVSSKSRAQPYDGRIVLVSVFGCKSTVLGLRTLSPSSSNTAFQRKPQPCGRYRPKSISIDYRQNRAETAAWLSLHAKSRTCVDVGCRASNRLFRQSLLLLLRRRRESQSRGLTRLACRVGACFTNGVGELWRRVAESNRSKRICNPLHNLFANPPSCVEV